jgi:DNA-binding XRE family transcriptional regulator
MQPFSDLSKRIKHYRRTLGENQTDFGKHFEVTRLTVGSWEKGTVPNSKHLPLIMERLTSAEDKPGHESSHQFTLPFNQPIDLAVKISPQASQTIYFEVWIKTKAS